MWPPGLYQPGRGWCIPAAGTKRAREQIEGRIDRRNGGATPWVCLSGSPNFGFSKNHFEAARFSDPAAAPIFEANRCLNEWGEGLNISGKGLKISAAVNFCMRLFRLQHPTLAISEITPAKQITNSGRLSLANRLTAIPMQGHLHHQPSWDVRKSETLCQSRCPPFPIICPHWSSSLKSHWTHLGSFKKWSLQIMSLSKPVLKSSCFIVRGNSLCLFWILSLPSSQILITRHLIHALFHISSCSYCKSPLVHLLLL